MSSEFSQNKRIKMYERVELVIGKYAGSRAKLAKILGIQQRTFDGYFSSERENNLWQYLSKILETYPFISRDWLYFGEGDLIKTATEGQKAEKTDDINWKERYYGESEAHKKTSMKLNDTLMELNETRKEKEAFLTELNQVRKELNRVQKELGELRVTPTVSGMETAISISPDD